MDFLASPVAIAVRTIVESCELDATEALRELEAQLTPTRWFDHAFKVFPIPHHLSVAKPKPWISHGIAFINSDDAIVIACKQSATQQGVHVTVIEKRLLQGAPQQPPRQRKTTLHRETVDLTTN